MRRKFLLAISCFSALLVSGQVVLRDADLIKLREIEHSALVGEKRAPSKSSDTDGSHKVEMIVRYESDSSISAIEANGGEIVSLPGWRTAIVRVDTRNAEAVAASSGVSGAMLSSKLKRANDVAIPMSGIPAVHAGNGLEKPYTGKGVVVGLFDTGIDPNHINFRGADGENRIKRVFYYGGATSVPEVYDTPAKIGTFDSDTRSDSHGTHVLGIMAGSFRDTSSAGAPDFRGVAPDAEIIAACGDGYNAQILDAFERIGKYAKEQGKPCVVNLSFGDNLGPHDGSDEFTQAINDVAEKYDMVICMAAGNERREPIAIVKQLTDDDPMVKTLALKGSTEVEGYFQTFGTIQIWTEDDTPFETSIDLISRTKPNEVLYSLPIPTKRSAYVAQGSIINEYLENTQRMDIITEGTKFHEIYSNSFMGGVAGVDVYNHRYGANLNLYLTARSATNASKYFARITVKGQPGKKIFMYCDGSYMSFGNRNIPGLDVPDGYGTNSNIASGLNTIAVGSYVSANRVSSGYETGTVGDISYFSSFGETLDGRIMPDVCAPGQVIISSRNSYLSTTGSAALYYPLEYSYYDNSNRQTYYWTTCAGTSQATPHVAGIAALWRQANPGLSMSEIIRLARESAATPGFESKGWGYGKIDALAGIKKLEGSSSADEIVANTTNAITVNRTPDGKFEIFAPGQQGICVKAYSVAGAEVGRAVSGTDTVTFDPSILPAGIYILNVTGSHTCRTVKVAL